MSTPHPALFSPEFQRNPYPTYAWHREGAPLQPLVVRPGTFLVFAHSHCLALFRDGRLTSQRPSNTMIGSSSPEVIAELSPFVDHMHRWLLQRDAPRHTLLRKLFNPAFCLARIERLRARVESIVARLLDDLEQSSQPDLIRDFAYPLPVQVVSEMLGLPIALYDRCTALTNDIAHWFSTVVRTPDLARAGFHAVLEIEGYFTELIRERRAHPQDDLMSFMIGIADDGEQLSDEELRAQCVMMLFAGDETTRHLIGNGMYTLLSHEQSLEQIRTAPGLIPNAIEELLRYESPIQAIARGVRTDIEYEGVSLPAGSSLVFMVGSAQRDSRQYPDADRFDLQRRHIRHLAFGGDVHTCLGATLARLESQVAIRALLARFPALSLVDDKPDWGANFAIRGLNSLAVHL